MISTVSRQSPSKTVRAYHGLKYSIALINRYLQQQEANEKQAASVTSQYWQSKSLTQKVQYLIEAMAQRFISPSWLYDYRTFISDALSEFSYEIKCDPSLGTVQYLLSQIKLRIGNNLSQDEELLKVMSKIASKTGVSYEHIESPERVNALAACLLR